MKTEGKLKNIDEDGVLRLKEGEYGQDALGEWFARPPGTHGMASLKNHKVEVDLNGKITVDPSILVNDGRGIWHGWLKKGVFYEQGDKIGE